MGQSRLCREICLCLGSNPSVGHCFPHSAIQANAALQLQTAIAACPPDCADGNLTLRSGYKIPCPKGIMRS